MNEDKNKLPNELVQSGQFLGNDSAHNFYSLADEFLEGAEILNQKHKNAPKWITYLVAFTALENYLKSYLLGRGKTLDYVVEEIGHKLQVALAECETLGLDLKDGNRPFIEKMMELSRVYTRKDFQFRSIGSWELFPPNDVIFFVGKIRDKIKAH